MMAGKRFGHCRQMVQAQQQFPFLPVSLPDFCLLATPGWPPKKITPPAFSVARLADCHPRNAAPAASFVRSRKAPAHRRYSSNRTISRRYSGLSVMPLWRAPGSTMRVSEGLSRAFRRKVEL